MRKLILLVLIVLLLLLPSCKSNDDFEWKVGPKSNLLIDDTIEMIVLEVDKTTIQFQIHNQTDKDYYYNKKYDLEVMQNGEWYSMDAGPGMGYTLEELSLLAGETKVENHGWLGDLFPGRFRLIKQFYMDGKETQNNVLTIAADFVIEQAG